MRRLDLRDTSEKVGDERLPKVMREQVFPDSRVGFDLDGIVDVELCGAR